MGQMEQPMSGGQNEKLLLARNMAQIELAHLHDDALIGWIDKYGKKFKELTDTDPYLLEELAEPGTHDEAIKRVEDIIYH
jgi:hypothetical protein